MQNSEPTHSRIHFCDLVAKGGVTSGVVYPAAIAKLSKHFSFRNLGGTSVGAIAVAAAAAAEFGRRNGGRDNFHLIDAIGSDLGTLTVGNKTKLFNLFQPSWHTKRLFAVLTAGIGKPNPWIHLLFAMLGQFGLATLAAILFCGLLTSCILLSPRVAVQIIGLPLAVTSAVIASICFVGYVFIRHVIQVLPNHYYGLCTGRSSSPSAENPALSDWFAEFLDQLANLPSGAEPLTFGNLWWPDVQAGEKKPTYDPNASTLAEEIAGRFINLEMITTSISEGRPYRIPFREDFDVRENSFWYRPEELKQFIPDRIVDWMMDHPRKSSRYAVMKDKGYYPLPDPWNLPVIFAVRMSLSFPLLLTAIPLYIVRRTEEGPSRCWFSDGGICSNFPIHFFDSPIPEWPTFAINLSDKISSEQEEVFIAQNMSEGVGLPLSNFDYAYGQGEFQKAETGSSTPFQQVFSFAKAILFTMHNWNDNTQTVLPGNRDRLVIVNLDPEEGGLNLNMSARTIKHLYDLGGKAADKLIDRFGPDSNNPFGLDVHRWVRLRVLLSAIEEYLVKIDLSCEEIDKERNLQIFITDGPATNYKWHHDQGQIACQTLSALRNLGSALRKDRPLSQSAPRPRSELRARPRL